MEIRKSVLGILLTFISLMKSIYGNSGVSIDQMPEPSFTQPIENVTVPVGRETILSCSVQNLGGFKVGWMRASDQTVLALQGRVVTHNARFSVTQEDMHTWRLKIKNIRETDRGCYMCQINASPMKKQHGCIDVYVPPDISDEDSSSDVTTKEGEDASLFCSASGHPTPRITWRREDGSAISLRPTGVNLKKVDSYNGSILNLSKVERRQMGAYLCIAANDVPPAVSKRVYLNVHFPPNLQTPKQLLGGLAGSDIIMECLIEAFPRPVNYWIRASNTKAGDIISSELYVRPDMLLDGKKHKIAEERLSLYEIKITLTVRNFTRTDLGTYTCISTNSLGRANTTIRLYEIRIPTTIATTTTTKATTTTRRTTTTTTTPQPTTELTTEFTTSTTDYPSFYPVGDPYAGEPQANQPFPEVIYSRSNSIFNDFLTILFSFFVTLSLR